MFADLSGVPADFIKNFLLVVSGLLAGVGVVAGFVMRKQKQPREISGGPVEVTGEVKVRQRAELWEARHGEVSRRLDGHDKEIESLWTTVRSENTQIRGEMAKLFRDIERALGRIEGKLDRKEPHE